MRVDRNFTVSDGERYLQQMGKFDHELALPTNIRHASLGGESALIQLIITWAATRDPARLKIYAREPHGIENYVRRTHGLVSALCADTVRSVETDQDLKSLTLNLALQRLEVMHGTKPSDAARGIAADMICADHLNRSSPLWLYLKTADNGRQLRSEEQFRGIARRLVRAAVPDAHRRQFDKSDTDALGSMLYETFRNTEDHALSNVEGVRLKKSIRGFRCRHHQITPESLQQVTDGSPELQRFCETLVPPRAGSQHLQLIEMSVFDSGPGYAERWLNQRTSEMSDSDELKAVLACFEKNATTKRHGDYGQGLPLVIRLLREKRSFLRLRTGRLSLYQDFSRLMGVAANALPDLQGAYKEDGSTRILPRVEGTLLSLIMPLRSA